MTASSTKSASAIWLSPSSPSVEAAEATSSTTKELVSNNVLLALSLKVEDVCLLFVLLAKPTTSQVRPAGLNAWIISSMTMNIKNADPSAWSTRSIMEPAVFAPKDSTLLTGPVESVATMLSTIAITRHACQNAVPTKFTLIPDPASVWKDSTGLLENARVVDLGRSLIL